MIGPDTDIYAEIHGCIRQRPAAQKGAVWRYGRPILLIRSPSLCPDAGCRRGYFAGVLYTDFQEDAPVSGGEGALVGWMRKIVIHTALAHYRNFRFQYEQATESLPRCPIRLPMHWQLSFEEIVELIATLPEAARMVFHLAVFDDVGSHDENRRPAAYSTGHLCVPCRVGRANYYKKK